MFKQTIMNSKKYLISKLEDLHNKFSNLSIRYQYDHCTQMHIVEVLPLSEYSENNHYIEMESDLSFDFDNRFFPESVMFISSESLTRITKAEFELLPLFSVKHMSFFEKYMQFQQTEYIQQKTSISTPEILILNGSEVNIIEVNIQESITGSIINNESNYALAA